MHGQKLHGVFVVGEGDVGEVGDWYAVFAQGGEDGFSYVCVVVVDDRHVAPRGAGLVGLFEVLGDVVGFCLNVGQLDE